MMTFHRRRAGIFVCTSAAAMGRSGTRRAVPAAALVALGVLAACGNETRSGNTDDSPDAAVPIDGGIAPGLDGGGDASAGDTNSGDPPIGLPPCTVDADCGDGRICQAGVCGPGCTPGVTACEANRVSLCNDEGRWAIVDDCAERGQVCEAEPAPTCRDSAVCGALRLNCEGPSVGNEADGTPVMPLLARLECSARFEMTGPPRNPVWRWRTERADGAAVETAEGRFSTWFPLLEGVGAWTVHVETTLEDSGETCRAETPFVVEATPGWTFGVTWQAEGDEDPTDEIAVDVDLHVVWDGADNACWTDGFGDCHWRNRFPDWGEPGVTTDNPLMEDSTTGFQGEFFRLLEASGTLQMGINLFQSAGYPSVSGNAWLFFGGELLSKEPFTLVNNQFVHVLEVNTGSFAILRRNEVTRSILPTCF